MANRQVEHGEVLTPVEARQRLISGRVRLVLIGSIALVVAAFIAITSWVFDLRRTLELPLRLPT